MEKSQVEEAETSMRVEVQMTPKFYERWIAHMNEIGERNKSAWIRHAMSMQLREEERRGES